MLLHKIIHRCYESSSFRFKNNQLGI